MLIAFSFGAFFEGAAGFGTPVAVTAALLIGLGFAPLEASGLSLIANTAPVAFGALGTPIIALQGVTGLDLHELSAQVGRQLPVFSVMIPFWLVAVYAGFRKTMEVWPALAVAGISFAVPQYLISNFHGPWLVDVVSAVCSMGALALFLRVWRPRGATAAAAPSHTDIPRAADAARVDAVGPALPDRVRVGHAAGEEPAQRDLGPEDRRRGTARAGAAPAAGGGGAEGRARGVRLQLAQRERHGDRAHRADRRTADGLPARADGARVRRHARAASARRSSPSPR